MTLPPGQRRIEGFPRFGTHLGEPPPEVPPEPAIEVRGIVGEPLSVPVADLATLPRRELTADFHCVAGWTATGLRWEGVAFETFYRRLLASLDPDGAATHVVFGGLDGYWSYMTIEDALGEDVLIADRLDGAPLGADHGAPARLVSPEHYGFINTKHLCRVELRSEDPRGYGAASPISNVGLRLLGYGHPPRARVWHEERHRHLPAWSIRLVGRALFEPIKFLSARGGKRG